jgi:hypothetical protein
MLRDGSLEKRNYSDVGRHGFCRVEMHGKNIWGPIAYTVPAW